MKQIIFSFLSLFPMVLYGQDTTYFNEKWLPTDRENHAYYRLNPAKKVGELVLIQDFYKNGQMQMQAYALADNPDVYVGDMFWYDSLGMDLSTRQLKNLSSVKELSYYHADGSLWQQVKYNKAGEKAQIIVFQNQQVIASGTIEGGSYAGTFYASVPNYFYEEQEHSEEQDNTEEQDAEDNSSDGIEDADYPQVEVAPPLLNNFSFDEVIFWENGTLASKKHYPQYNYLGTTTYWDKNGQLLSEIKEYNPGSSYTYYTRNGFALAVKAQDVSFEDQNHRRELTYYTPTGDLLQVVLYQNGELELMIDYTNGQESRRLQYRDGQPYEGKFSLEYGNKQRSFEMIQGEYRGPEQTINLQTKEVIAEGVYRNNQPYTGTFYSADTDDMDVPAQLLSYQDGLLEGLQYRYLSSYVDEIVETYEMKSGKREGFRKTYKNGELWTSAVYQNDSIQSGQVEIGKELLIYENSQLVEKREKAYLQDIPGRIEKFKDGRITEVQYANFIISENVQDSYTGYYRDGLPYTGYFKMDAILDDIQTVGLYKNGTLISVYSFDFIKQMESTPFYTYDIKSIYKNGKIFEGPEYKLAGKGHLIVSYYKDGQVSAFDVNIFAMHYFNRLSFQKQKNSLTISELTSPVVMNLAVKDDIFEAEIKKDKQLLGLVNIYMEPSAGSPNSRTVYYQKDNIVQAYISRVEFKKEMEEEIELSNSLIIRMMNQLPNQQKNTLTEVFDYYYALFMLEDLNGAMEEGGFSSDLINEDTYLGYLSYSEQGSPLDGVLIQQHPDSSLSVSSYEDGILQSTSTYQSIAEFLEKSNSY